MDGLGDPTRGGERPLHEAWCLFNLEKEASVRGDVEAAQTYANKALRIFESFSQKSGEPRCFFDLGQVVFARGSLKVSLACTKEALSICSRIGDRDGEALCLQRLADAVLAQGNTDAAVPLRSRH